MICLNYYSFAYETVTFVAFSAAFVVMRSVPVVSTVAVALLAARWPVLVHHPAPVYVKRLSGHPIAQFAREEQADSRDIYWLQASL